MSRSPVYFTAVPRSIATEQHQMAKYGKSASKVVQRQGEEVDLMEWELDANRRIIGAQ